MSDLFVRRCCMSFGRPFFLSSVISFFIYIYIYVFARSLFMYCLLYFVICLAFFLDVFLSVCIDLFV